MEKASSPCSMEVRIISAEDLRINDRPVKKKTFVTIETTPDNSQSTSMDSEGGSYPSWNQKLELSLPHSVNHIRLFVKYKSGSSVRTIGSVNIPLSDFLEDYIPPNCLHFLSYRLREHDGDRNGIVNIAIQMKGAAYSIPRVLPSSSTARVHQVGYTNSNTGCRSWVQASGNYHLAAYNSRVGGIVVGVPVPKGYVV